MAQKGPVKNIIGSIKVGNVKKEKNIKLKK
jgi:hypothetical protein